jgi:cytochrome c553
MRITVRCTVAALSLLAAAGAQAAADAEAGRLKANTCMGCHGIPAYNNVYPTYRVPKLGGQSAVYIASALHAYKSGERPHKTMQGQAASLSDQDIDDIAAYLAVAPARQ